MMRNILIIGAILFAGVLFGQTKKNVSKTWENRDSEIAQKVFSKYQEKENNKLSQKYLEPQSFRLRFYFLLLQKDSLIG